MVEVREALLEVRRNANTAIVEIKIEAHSLAEEMGSFRSQICCVGMTSKINYGHEYYNIQSAI